MGARPSSTATAAEANTPADANATTDGARKVAQYANLRSSVAASRQKSAASANLIDDIYNEDFLHIDHMQAMRFPPIVAKQLKDAVRHESERRCSELEKTMARCLQEKMWTSWKCQKERDAYYHCVEDVEAKNLSPDPEKPDAVDLLTAYRWKYNLGVFHGEIIGRNNLMRTIWKDYFPDRVLPHPWVEDE